MASPPPAPMAQRLPAPPPFPLAVSDDERQEAEQVLELFRRQAPPELRHWADGLDPMDVALVYRWLLGAEGLAHPGAAHRPPAMAAACSAWCGRTVAPGAVAVHGWRVDAALRTGRHGLRVALRLPKG